MAIYLAMWFTDPSDYKHSSEGASYRYGIIFCCLTLLGFTMLDQISLNFSVKKTYVAFILSSGLLAYSAYYSFFQYDRNSFIFYMLGLVLYNCFFRGVNSHLERTNQTYSSCLEAVDRIEKLFVLCTMPATIMLGLDRDDVQDCLLWVFCLAGISLIVSIGLWGKVEEK